MISRQIIILDGNSFYSLESFYDEVERKLTKDRDGSFGRNLNAFDDILWGGFGCYEYEAPVTIKWLNSQKSKGDLGWEETIKHLKHVLAHCHPSNEESVKKDIRRAKLHLGETLYEEIIRVIKSHDHIELLLQ